MAPRKEAAHPFKFGEVGRQTGITLPDNGIRDEDGFEPVEGLFSTGKSTVAGSIRKLHAANATLDSDDMDEGESTIPEPATVLESRSNGRMVLPPPRGKSPAKTSLNSPARRNPSLGPASSPVRGSIVEPRSVSVTHSVRRMLDFSTGDSTISPAVASAGKSRGSSAKPRSGIGKLGKAPVISPMKHPYQTASIDDYEDDLPDQVQGEDTAIEEVHEDSYQVNGFDDEDLPTNVELEGMEEPEDEPEPEHKPAKIGRKGKGTSKGELTTLVRASDEPLIKKGRGRPPRKAAVSSEEALGADEPPKKKRKSDATVEPASQKRKSANKATASSKLKSKGGSKKSTLATIEESDSPQVQRGPPLPRRGGLTIQRRETPMESNSFSRTRSGRSSFKPLAWWRGERAEYSDEEVEDSKGAFIAQRVREVVRVEEPAVRKPQKWKSRAKSVKRRLPDAEEEDILAEPWEFEPGRIFGDVVVWDPEDPAGAHGEERDDEIALSSVAINTQPVADASFTFAKTLTLPFFGSGVVDLPPGSIKRQKNARKMQMAFFVFTGRVKAIVNGNEFRISKGGMFQVPRGNTYSIENDYDTEARIFFSQGCEVIQEDPNESQG